MASFYMIDSRIYCDQFQNRAESIASCVRLVVLRFVVLHFVVLRFVVLHFVVLRFYVLHIDVLPLVTLSRRPYDDCVTAFGCYVWLCCVCLCDVWLWHVWLRHVWM